jgi:hypothetical protein
MQPPRAAGLFVCDRLSHVSCEGKVAADQGARRLRSYVIPVATKSTHEYAYAAWRLRNDPEGRLTLPGLPTRRCITALTNSCCGWRGMLWFPV